MFRTIFAALLLLAIPSSIVSADDASVKTTEVKHKALTLKVPENWKEKPTSSSMRLATYEIHGSKDDQEPAELAIYSFQGGGGSVQQNIARWVKQFDSKGREQKITRGKAGDSDYYVVEVSGTYNKPIGPPIRRQTKPVKDSRMLAVILQLDSGVYYLKMTGGDRIVQTQAEALRQSFGGDIESEEVHEG